MTVQHIVILGAARSGTKVLRDALADAASVGKVPYDIPYVWRFGNESSPDDALAVGDLTPRARKFISAFIGKYAAGSSVAVVEKTVGNTIRVPFVSAVLPEARYVHVVRDGVDVIESTRRQWTTPADLGYLISKLRHFPIRMVPTYGRKFAWSAARRRLTRERRVGVWGVRYPGIANDLERDGLLAVCCRQWSRAVVNARDDLARLDLPFVEVRYESLVRSPETELRRVLNSVELPYQAADVERAASVITNARAGAGRRALTEEERRDVDREVGGVLASLGYPPATEEVKA